MNSTMTESPKIILLFTTKTVMFKHRPLKYLVNKAFYLAPFSYKKHDGPYYQKGLIRLGYLMNFNFVSECF